MKKQDDRSKDLIQQAKEAPILSHPSSSGQPATKESQPVREAPKESLKESDKQLNKPAAIDPKKEIPKMMGAKKETEAAPATLLQEDPSKKGWKKFQGTSEEGNSKNRDAINDKDDGTRL